MARSLRIDYAGAWHHVMNRGLGRRAIFETDGDRKAFLKILEETSRIYTIEIHAFSLMGNHYHLLIHTPKAGLSRALRHLNSLYTQASNRSRRTDGPLFRGRFKSKLVESEEYLLELVRYIHMNPVEAGICRNPAAHPWTSHAAYLYSRKRPDWLHTREILEHFESPQALDRFVREGVPDSFREKLTRENVILGTEGFKEWVYRNWVGKKKKKGISKKDQELRLLARPGDVVRTVCHAYDLSLRDLKTSRPFRGNEAKKVAVHFLRNLSGMSQRDIARWTGANEFAVAKACERFRGELTKNRRLKRQTTNIARAIMSYVKP